MQTPCQAQNYIKKTVRTAKMTNRTVVFITNQTCYLTKIFLPFTIYIPGDEMDLTTRPAMS